MTPEVAIADMVAGNDLNYLIDKTIFNRDRYHEHKTKGGMLLPIELQIPDYSHSMEKAMLVVDLIKSHSRMDNFTIRWDRVWDVGEFDSGYDNCFNWCMEDKSLPVAICKAALYLHYGMDRKRYL